ncbi:NADPH-dependent F420 reductase [Cellulomonas soli]
MAAPSPTSATASPAPSTGRSSSSPCPTLPSPTCWRRTARELAGKVVVDITNPLDFATFDSLVVPAGSSAAAQIAAALPDSHVLKAFNTTFAGTLTSGSVSGAVPTTVLIAGDDTDAKATLAAAIEAGGLRALDAGALSRAHELEAVGFLQLTLAASEKIGWTGGFGLVK